MSMNGFSRTRKEVSPNIISEVPRKMDDVLRVDECVKRAKEGRKDFGVRF